MTIRDILVHLDDGASCAGRLDAAIQLAQTHQAHLTGLYIMPHSSIPGYIDVQIPADILQTLEDRLIATAQTVEEKFKQATDLAGLAAEWRCQKGFAADLVLDHGHYADLIVVGQRDPDSIGGPALEEIPDHIILSAGRPVLVIPKNYAGGTIGKRVIVGWDRGQRATRAIHDAIPLLQKADQVSVLIVNRDDSQDDGSKLPAVDIAHHLARHDVHVEADHITSTDMGVGDQLLARAADMGADLLVSGAYGHARWRELILGGVTRQLLDQMPIPLLMSH
ncbi:MAG: universal stress protein [Rhodospirillales bacterium]|nr:universal stress protein [Rhodospirillales bacterium]